MIRRQCIECDGDGELVVGVRNIEITGGVIDFVTKPCPACQGEGWLPPFTWRTVAAAIGIYVVVQVLVTIAVLTVIQVAAPRPAASNVIPAEVELAAGKGSVSASSSGNLSLLQTGAPGSPRLGAPSSAGSVGTALVSGLATWYDAPTIRDAAAGPELRVGDWRGSAVTVRRGDRSVVVLLTDSCACRDRLIDLDDRAFARLAPLSIGVIEVEVEWGGPLPATDTEP